MEGAVERVRPKMMTVVAIMAGLLPIMWSTGTGSEIMQRIAVPMIGGMISSTLLTLIVIPAIFGLVKGFRAGVWNNVLWRGAYARAIASGNTTSISVPECVPVLIWNWARLASTSALVSDRLTPELSEA